MFQAPSDFVPDFSKSGGLIAAVAQDAATGEVLMLAWMNREAWEATLATGEAHYWSRSRQKLRLRRRGAGNRTDRRCRLPYRQKQLFLPADHSRQL